MMNKEMPMLNGSRIILRALNLEDAKNIFAYASNQAVTKYVFWHAHETITDSINFLKELINSKQLMWGIQLKNKNKIIGTCGFINHNKITRCLTIGYTLNQNYWKKGYTKEALNLIINYGFNNLNAIRIEGICVADNTASEKTMLSCNMIFEGILHDNFIKNQQIFDTKIFAVTKRNYLNLKK